MTTRNRNSQSQFAIANPHPQMPESNTQSTPKPGATPHIIMFGILLVLTLTTVGLSYAGLDTRTAIAAALGIAALQGALILVVLMHLHRERKSVTGLVAFTICSLAGLLVLTYAAFHSTLHGTVHHNAPMAVHTEEGAAH